MEKMLAEIKFVVTLTRYISDGYDYSSLEYVETYSRPLIFFSLEEMMEWMETYHYEKDRYHSFVYTKEGKTFDGRSARYFATVHIPSEKGNAVWTDVTHVGHME